MTSLKLKTKIQGPVAIIGDLHGQVEKLIPIIEYLRGQPDYQQRWIVFIGDFVDRGPDSKSTINLVLQLIQEHPRTTAIMGNHELAMCSALGWLPSGEGSNWDERWLDFYNAETTFDSYGIEFGDLEALAAAVPEDHREFLVNLPWCVEHPDFLFVHAGLDPNMPFKVQMRILQQRDFSLNHPQWLCEKSFVSFDPPLDCPLILVSGHVKVDEVIVKPRRILVDTTGGIEGELSCLLMPEGTVISSSDATDEEFAEHSPSDRKPWWKFWR